VESESNLVLLHEVEPRDVLLSSDEAAELQTDGLSVQVLPSVSDDVDAKRPYRIQGNHRVGYFKLASGRFVQIETKIPIANVFSLLAASYQFYADRSPFLENVVPYSQVRARPLQPLVEHFAMLVERLLREGLLRRYVEREENLSCVRGQLLFDQQIRQNLVHGHRLFCRFTTSDVDNIENRILLWTLLLLQRTQRWPDRLRHMLQALIMHCGEVSVIPIASLHVPEVTYDRLNGRYRGVHAWCRFFIDQLTLLNKSGTVEFYGFRLNMFELFERFVFSVFQEAARGKVGIHVDKMHLPLDKNRRVGIHPDLLIRGQSFVTVGDAKYKITKDSVGRHPDLYQVVAYSTALGLIEASHRPQALLIYPASERTPELVGDLSVLTSVRGDSQLTVRALWIDLSGERVFDAAVRAAGALLDEVSQTPSLRSVPQTDKRAGPTALVPNHFSGMITHR